MNPGVQLSIEVNTLHEILDELDYYRLLQLDPDCVQGDIEPARARPRRSITLTGERARRLRGQRQGQRDLSARQGGGREPLGSRQACAVRRGPQGGCPSHDGGGPGDRGAGTPQVREPRACASDPKAEKYWHMALKDWDDKNFKGCVMNIQFALSFEPDNEVMKEWLEKAKTASTKKSAENKNPYKLRIV